MRRLFLVAVWLFALCLAPAAMADKLTLDQVIDGVYLGISPDQLLQKVPGLQEAKISMPDMKTYELAAPTGDLKSLKCAFKEDKLVLVSFESNDKKFEDIKTLLEMKYGPFAGEAGAAVYERKDEKLHIRLIRTGEDGTAAQVIINDPGVLGS